MRRLHCCQPAYSHRLRVSAASLRVQLQVELLHGQAPAGHATALCNHKLHCCLLSCKTPQLLGHCIYHCNVSKTPACDQSAWFQKICISLHSAALQSMCCTLCSNCTKLLTAFTGACTECLDFIPSVFNLHKQGLHAENLHGRSLCKLLPLCKSGVRVCCRVHLQLPCNHFGNDAAAVLQVFIFKLQQPISAQAELGLQHTAFPEQLLLVCKTQQNRSSAGTLHSCLQPSLQKHFRTAASLLPALLESLHYLSAHVVLQACKSVLPHFYSLDLVCIVQTLQSPHLQASAPLCGHSLQQSAQRCKGCQACIHCTIRHPAGSCKRLQGLLSCTGPANSGQTHLCTHICKNCKLLS